MIHCIIAVKSGDLSSFFTVYNFIVAALKNPYIKIVMIFFYQNGANILLNTETNKQMIALFTTNNLYTTICSSSYKKRGLTYKNIFQPISIIQFVTACDKADRVIQF